MNRLLLVRHAEPEIDVAVPSAAWPLTARGIASTERLATTVAEFAPTRVISSPEVKAVETGRVVATALGLPLEVNDHFAEHGAGPDQFIPDYREFRAMVRRFFDEPEALVFRDESCQAAAARFDSGVLDLAGRPDDIPIVITHGRIMSSWLANVSGGTAWDIWTALRMPDLIEVDLDARAFRTVAFSLT
jgi:broad specificity phosphatase PhoE